MTTVSNNVDLALSLARRCIKLTTLYCRYIFYVSITYFVILGTLMSEVNKCRNEFVLGYIRSFGNTRVGLLETPALDYWYTYGKCLLASFEPLYDCY